MRNESDVRNRIRTLLVQELDRRVEEAKQRLPHLCQHNHRQPLDTRKAVEGDSNTTYNRVTSPNGKSLPTIGLCMLGVDDPEQWQGTICEDPIDAQRCPFFTPHQTKEEILGGFYGDLTTVGWVPEHMPELAGLFWVLDEGYQIQLPWWKRLWFRLLRIKIEPLATPSKDITALLPPPTETSDVVHSGETPSD